MKLSVINKVGRLNFKFFAVGRYLADHTLDVMHAVFFHGAAIELVEVLAGGTHVDIENIHLSVGVFIADEHGMLCRIHTADLGAILLALFRTGGAARADTLHKHDRMRMLAVGRTQQRAARRTRGVHETLELQRSDNILRLRIGIFVELLHGDRIEAGRHDDGAVFLLHELVFRLIVDCARTAHLGANAALAGFQHHAVLRVDGRDLRNSLCKRDIDRTAIVHAEVEFVGNLLLRAFFGAQTAAGADILFDIARLTLDSDIEIADKALDIRDLGIGEDADLLVLRHIHHFRCQNTGSAIERREGLVELCHFAADGGLGLHDVDGETGVGDVKRRLDTGNTAADNERPLGDGTFAGGKRCVEVDLCHCRAYPYAPTSTARGCWRSLPYRG